MSDALVKNVSNPKKKHARRHGHSDQNERNNAHCINPFFESLPSKQIPPSQNNIENNYSNGIISSNTKNTDKSKHLKSSLKVAFQINNDISASEEEGNSSESNDKQVCNESAPGSREGSTDSHISGDITVFPRCIGESIASRNPIVYCKGTFKDCFEESSSHDKNYTTYDYEGNEIKTTVCEKSKCCKPESCHDRSAEARKKSDRMNQLLLTHNTRTSGIKKTTKYERSISACVELVKLHFSDVENRLFEMFGNKETKTINIRKFLAGILVTGLRSDDPRLEEMYENVESVKKKHNKVDDDNLVVDYHTFMGIISENLEIVVRAFSHSFIIPDFRTFCDHIDEIYMKCKDNRDGETPSYIAQLSRINKEFWAVSLCTVDGQRYSVGDVKQPFTVQSCSKPLTYAIACADNGPNKMHKYIGLEPSGRFFNELCLDFSNKPHNPMINSGAIMTAALVKPEYSAADKFDYIFEMYKRLAAGEYLGFNNSVFLSEKECADRNFALGYFMREKKCFPPETKLHETLDFYFQLCSLEINAESGAVMAATLANGGINPLSGDPVLTCEAVRNTLTLMHSCGMYNYSGQFAFKVGLPAKSGVSGCILLVVPNTLGICLWSPALDLNGNSCRGVQFCSELVNLFKFHHFDNLRGNSSSSNKIDPRVSKTESSAQILFDLLFCVAANDISSLRRHALAGTDLESADYDGRTALHVAASEGHVELVEFLLEKCQVNPAPKDRWQRTPLEDARNFGHPLVEEQLEKYCKMRGIEIPPKQNKLTNATA